MGFPRLLGRAAATVVVGGIAVGACLAALAPGVARLAAGSRYEGRVGHRLSVLDEPTRIYDRNGDLLDTIGLVDRRPVRLAAVPQVLIDAVVATEDRTFYDNPGVDAAAMARALLTNVEAGELEQGGSTITQQLVKNRMFRKPRRDLGRKAREVALALRLTREWSKDRILEEYLNTVYFGRNAYGVRAAAERFFGRDLADLGLAEASLLAGVIANPSRYDPFLHPDAARRRRATVLRRMVRAGYLTPAAARLAGTAPLPTVAPEAELRSDGYYVNWVKELLLADRRLGDTPQARYRRVFRGGLRVHTAFDPRLSLLAQSAVSEILPDSRFTAAMAVLDPRTGEVPAIVAGPGFERSQVNLATMPGTATNPGGRQPGSTFKAVTLAAALENGYSPNDTVDGSSPCTVTLRGYGTGRTQNAEGGGGGVRTLRSATVGSVNCAYFRLGAALRPSTVVEMAHRLGVRRDVADVLVTSIGSASGVSPLEMATVYGTFAAEGIRHDPVFIRRVIDRDGTVLIENGTGGVRAIDVEVARTVTDVLRGVITSGTGTRARLPGRDAAGKTGTTDNKANAWFAGYTPQLVAAVWMGDPAAYTPMRNVGRFGAVYGGTYPAMIWQRFMAAALEGAPVLRFTPPDPRRWPPARYISPERGRVRGGGSATTVPGGAPPPTTATAPPPAVPPAPGPPITGGPARPAPGAPGPGPPRGPR